MKRFTSNLVVAAALALTAGSALAEPTPLKLPALKPCQLPAYPRAAVGRPEEGLVILGVQVDESGAVLDTKVLLSSGSPDLDKATQRAFRGCVHAPGRVNDQPVTMWGPVQHIWSVDPSNGKWFAGLKQAALDGDVKARYVLGVMLGMPGRTEAEQDAGQQLVTSAAQAGDAMAQIALAAKYEAGKRVPRDIPEAHRWYAKAAAQGNIVAIDHLRLLGDDH